jgi:hypothetical protein
VHWNNDTKLTNNIHRWISYVAYVERHTSSYRPSTPRSDFVIKCCTVKALLAGVRWHKVVCGLNINVLPVPLTPHPFTPPNVVVFIALGSTCEKSKDCRIADFRTSSKFPSSAFCDKSGAFETPHCSWNERTVYNLYLLWFWKKKYKEKQI